MSHEEKEDSFAPLIIVTLYVIAFIAIIGTCAYIVTMAKDVLKSRYKNKEDSEQKHLMESTNDEYDSCLK